ncbi:MAG: hypothetical protein GX625_00565 [Clostridiaceae bacterium]|nr:hypothetical protein [Clostridiaceae bacterium]
MNYRETLQAVNTEKALSIIGINPTVQGGYAKFDCPQCDQKALIKLYGDKKNLYYCPKCHVSGHIISLTMKLKGLEWEAAKNLLLGKAVNVTKKITEEFHHSYELHYTDFLEKKGISKDICSLLEVGVPKGKTMLAGCVAFPVKDEEGMLVAYWGIRMKDEKPVFHKTFSPENYLFGFSNIDFDYDVYFTTDIFKCLQLIDSGLQCVCNFGLPYISKVQMDLLGQVERVTFSLNADLVKPFAIELAQTRNKYYRFINE